MRAPCTVCDDDPRIQCGVCETRQENARTVALAITLCVLLAMLGLAIGLTLAVRERLADMCRERQGHAVIDPVTGLPTGECAEP